MTTDIKIYAIVVTYNGAKWIDQCFGSLVKSSIPVKILAIDNGSIDGTPNIIREKYPQIEIIETGKNLGFGKANNIGLKRVVVENADYAFLLNQDAWIENDTIEKLVEVQIAHPEFGLLSPLPYDGEHKHLDYIYKQHYEKEVNYKNIYLNKTFEISFINAACWLLSYYLIKKIGGFHPNFLMHGEDKNYIDRIKYLKDIKIGITTNSRYFHDRKTRSETEHTYERRLYAIKSKIKTEFYNPNLNITKIFYYQIKYHLNMLMKGQYSILLFFQLFYYCIRIFIQAFSKRRIYIRI